MQSNLKKLLGNSNVWLYGDKLYTDRLEMKSPYKTKQCLLFTAEQFSMFNEDTTIEGAVAIIKSKKTKLEIPGQVIENPVFPDFSGEPIAIKMPWIQDFVCSAKEFFIDKTYCATPATNAITYIKQTNPISAIVSAEFVEVCKMLESVKLLYKTNSSMTVVGKDIKVNFPIINSEITYASVEAILESEEKVGAVLIPAETMQAISKLPSKTETIKFIDNKAVVQSTTMNFVGEIQSKGTVDAAVLLASIDCSREKFVITTNAIKYKIADNIYKIVPLVG